MAATNHDEDGYPAELESQLTLAGGRRVRIRALHTCEAEPIRALHCRLSDRSRYLRFLSPMPALPDLGALPALPGMPALPGLPAIPGAPALPTLP